MARKKSVSHQFEQSRLAGIISSSRDAIYTIDLSANITSWNSGAEKLFGFTTKEVLGKNLMDLTIPPNRKPEVSKIVKLLKKKKDIPAFETIRKRKNGSLIHVLFSLSYLTNIESEVVGASVVARDVSEQRRTILELEQANTILYNIIQNTPDAIYVKDLEGRYLMLNNAASTYLGKSTLELLGKRNDEVISKKIASHIKRHDTKVYKEKRPLQFEETLVVQGKKKVFLSTKVPYIDNNKQLIGLIGVSKDITELKEKEQEREDMLAIVSHELKNPLTSISLYSNELQKSVGSPKQASYAAKIYSQTKKLNGFIHELLDLARIESHTLELNYEDFSLQEIVDDLVESIHNEYPSHTIEVTGSYTYSIRADKFRLSQILTNLLTNAIKYSPEANTVRLIITYTRSEVLIEVKDFGIGIPKKHQTHVFDKYFRVRNKQTPGTGLGLHIVSQMVKLHGGKIWVESKKHAGSSFFVSLPQKKKKNI